MTQRRLSLFGATGSVGQSTLDLVRRDGEAWQVKVLTANSDVAELAKLAREFLPDVAVIADETLYGALKDALDGTGIEIAAGADALVEAAQRPTDLVMAAIVGTAGWRRRWRRLPRDTTSRSRTKKLWCRRGVDDRGRAHFGCDDPAGRQRA
jgi:1-deoxy-D-xylulose 5-phosphate reductoisomerase